MQSSWLRITITTLLLIGCTIPMEGQAAASAFGKKDVLDVGAGVSTFHMDWGSERLEGVTAWGDFNIFAGPLARISPEVEFRALPWSIGDNPSQLQDWTLQGGVKARLLTRSRFQLFAKGLLGPGHFGFVEGAIPSHPTMTSRNVIVYSAGGGVDMRLNPKWAVRGEYEVQWWPNLVYRNTALTPSGADVGVQYSFDHWFHR